MARNLSERFDLALTERNVELALLLEAEVASGFVRIWTGIGPMLWNGVEFTGLGGLIGLGAVEESGDDLKATGVAVSLRGVKAADVSLALNELRLNKAGRIWMATFEPGHLLGENGDLLGEPGYELEFGESGDVFGEGGHILGESVGEAWIGVPEGGLIDSPKILFKGRFDTALHDDSDPTAPVLAVNFESDQIDLERPKERRLTDEAQKALYPGDRAGEFIGPLQDKEIVWGRKS